MNWSVPFSPYNFWCHSPNMSCVLCTKCSPNVQHVLVIGYKRVTDCQGYYSSFPTLPSQSPLLLSSPLDSEAPPAGQGLAHLCLLTSSRMPSSEQAPISVGGWMSLVPECIAFSPSPWPSIPHLLRCLVNSSALMTHAPQPPLLFHPHTHHSIPLPHSQTITMAQ